MGTGRVAYGNVCPRCGDSRRQDILDVRYPEDGYAVARLMCVACEHVWTVRPLDWRTFWFQTWAVEEIGDIETK